jgi:N-acetyl-anhydromuramyl-L-alanine amidase AmpD
MVSIVAGGCASTPPSAQHFGPITAQTPASMIGSQPFASPKDVYHVVGPSETLWRISKTYNVDMTKLMQVNRISDPTKIKKGQRLTIPDTMGPKPLIPLFPNRRWTHIVIHHTATEVGNSFDIDRLHHQRGFWNGLGYHFLIDNGTGGRVDGQIEVGPRWLKQMVGAHANANGMNEHGIGISLVGNFSERKVSARELDSLIFLVRTLKNYYNISDQNIIRHRDVPGKNTECPGNYFPWREFKQRIAS